jgi:hypothetical protein
MPQQYYTGNITAQLFTKWINKFIYLNFRHQEKMLQVSVLGVLFSTRGVGRVFQFELDLRGEESAVKHSRRGKKKNKRTIDRCRHKIF